MEFDSNYFSDNYIEARKKFLAAIAECNGSINTHINSVAGTFKGHSLATDICYIGPPSPKRLLLISSGAHGVEGYCGSAVQTALLKHDIGRLLPDTTGLYLIHALNPYGLAHDRRVTEDNVDLNRNFIDFPCSDADGSEYELVRSKIYPDDWASSQWKDVEYQVHKFIDRQGITALQKAVSRGQYCHPNDPFFTGVKPTWSRKVWETVVDRALASTDLIVHLDIHSGLGATGELERILPVHEKGVAYDRAAQWYGEELLRCPAFSNSNSPHIEGDLPSVLRKRCPSAVTVGLEFGTVSLGEMLISVIADNWLTFCPQASPEQTSHIKARIKNAFYVDTDDWKKAVWTQSWDMVIKSLSGLHSL